MHCQFHKDWFNGFAVNIGNKKRTNNYFCIHHISSHKSWDIITILKNLMQDLKKYQQETKMYIYQFLIPFFIHNLNPYPY